MADTITPCQAALWFAAKAIPVLPLHGVTEAAPARAAMPQLQAARASTRSPASRPTGSRTPPTDLDVIRGWFREHYWLNYGVLTDKLLVIDVDPRNGGDQSWAAISAQPTRAVPHTWRVRTGGGGEHILFRNTLGVRCGDLDRGIEIKAKGGYIVGPTCSHESGRRYEWQPQCSPKDAPLADPPEWLAKLIGNRTYLGAPMPPQAWVKQLRETFYEGARRKALLRIVGKLATIPGNDPQIVTELMLAWSTVRCLPPLPESEVASVVEDIFTREHSTQLAQGRWGHRCKISQVAT